MCHILQHFYEYLRQDLKSKLRHSPEGEPERIYTLAAIFSLDPVPVKSESGILMSSDGQDRGNIANKFLKAQLKMWDVSYAMSTCFN